jgi:hypothetical protein
MLAHAGSLSTGATIGTTLASTGIKAAAQEVVEEVLDNLTGGLRGLTKAKGGGWYCEKPHSVLGGASKRVRNTTPSPALKNSPYNPDIVSGRRKNWQKLYGGFDPKAAANKMGYNKRIPPQKAPFNSHGQNVFFNGKNYVTPDIDAHNVTNGWKMFDRKGRRIGTYTSDLKRIKD